MEWVIIGVIVFCLYFLPAMIAMHRKHHNETAIFWLNLLAGWTFLGWLGSLIWALTAVRQELKPTT